MSLHAALEVQVGAMALRAEIDVEPGEVLAVLGPNGAGKSSLLRCVAGLRAIDQGMISIDDLVLDDPATGAFVEPEDRSVGVVFQDHALFDHLTALENVAFGLRARGESRVAARATARAWLDRVGLSEHADARPRALSGGQSQRVALARALATRPRTLLLDEPLAALDAGTRATVRRELDRHVHEFDGMTVLVTHDPVDAYVLADRVAILDAGAIVQSGSLAEVTSHPRSRYVADLVGLNLVSGVVTDHQLVTQHGARVVLADSIDGPVFAVIRPHSVSLVTDPPIGASARNVWPATIVDIVRLGDRVRVSLSGEMPLSAEITVAALDALRLRPGDRVHAVVKATEIEVYPA